MGGDGGSIPGRADVVKTAGYRFIRNLGGMGYTPNTQVRAGSERFGRQERRRLWWRHCALTQEPLQPGQQLSACRKGQLFVREHLLEWLLSRRQYEKKQKHTKDGENVNGFSLPPNLQHIKSRKDIKDLQNVEFAASTTEEGSDGTAGGKKTFHLICPITKNQFDGGGVKGVVIWTCGCLMSHKALQVCDMGFKSNLKNGNIDSQDCHSCPICGALYSTSDIVEICPLDDAEETP